MVNNSVQLTWGSSYSVVFLTENDRTEIGSAVLSGQLSIYSPLDEQNRTDSA